MAKIKVWNSNIGKQEDKEVGNIYLNKVRDVKMPSRGFVTSAGIDFFVPKFNKEFIAALKDKNPSVFKNEDTPFIQGISVNSYNNGTANGTIIFSSPDKATQVTYGLDDANDSKIKFDDGEGKNYFLLAPHKGVNIPSGIRVQMEECNRALIAYNKSGIATKHQLQTGACVVDYEYTGEVHINVINNSTKIVRIYEDMKLVQFIETPVYTSIICEINDEDYSKIESERGSDGFGSTDKKIK